MVVSYHVLNDWTIQVVSKADSESCETQENDLFSRRLLKKHQNLWTRRHHCLQLSVQVMSLFYFSFSCRHCLQNKSSLFRCATMFFSQLWVTFTSFYFPVVSRTVNLSFNSSIPELLPQYGYCSQEGQSKTHNV